MRNVINNLFQSRAPLMVVLRYVLVGLVVLMGLGRLRLLLVLLGLPDTYRERDILEEYLMAKALMTGVNPYLPINELARMFVGVFPLFPHPVPYPPFVAIMSIPLLWFGISKTIIVWFIFELGCLATLSCMLTVLWKGRLDWIRAVLIFFILLAWFPVMAELFYGQLSILLTVLLLAALLALRKEHRILAGALIGLSVAIKMITWPLIIYFALKKEWRTMLSSGITALGLNLVALAVMGIGPFFDYYLRVTAQVLNFYQAVIYNISLWSIGYRLFEGVKSTSMDSYFNAPPLVYLPGVAPLVSLGLAAAFLLAGLAWAIQSKDRDIAFSILVCVIVAVSPISWNHYYVMIIIALAVLSRNLVNHSFPAWKMLIFIIITLMLFLGNDQIDNAIILLNGGMNLLNSNDNQITFASSLLICLPIVELIGLTMLLWRTGVNQQPRINNKVVSPGEV